MSRVLGEPMTSYISRRRRWWTLVHEMDNTLELGDTVQGSMMLEQAGLSRFEKNMVLRYSKGQRTMTAIAEALLQQHYDVHHRGRETPTPTGNFIFSPIVGDVVPRPVSIWQTPNHQGIA